MRVLHACMRMQTTQNTASHAPCHMPFIAPKIDGLKQPQHGAGGGSFANDSRCADTINAVYDMR